MSEEFESLDAAAVAGAQGWPSVLLSPIDVFATGMHDFDDLLKPPNVAPSSLGVPLATPPAATTTPKPIAITATSNNTTTTTTTPNTTTTASTTTITARAQARHALPVAKKVALKPKKTMNATTADNNNINSKGTSSIIASGVVVDFAHMVDIGGTTAARSRQMSDEERRVMLYKRKLRNRASAARSREKRCRTITELANEVAALLDRSKLLDHRAILLQQENHRIQQENIQLRANNQRLRAILEAAGHTEYI